MIHVGLLTGLLGCTAITDPVPMDEYGELAEELNGEPDWAMIGRTARRTSNNPLENVIGTSNVALLVETWSAEAEGSFAPSLALWGSRLFVSNLQYFDPVWGVGYSLQALDPDTGNKLWEAPLPEDQSGSFSPESFTSAMAVAHGRIHVQHTNFSPLLSTRTGKLVGNGALKTGMDDRISAPLLKGDTLVVETWAEYHSDVQDYRRTLFATDTTTNTRLWRKALGSAFQAPRDPALGSGVVFTVDSDASELLALSAADGSTVWTSAAASGQLGSPSVVSGQVYVVSRPNTLTAYDALTGEQRWQTVYTGGAASGAPERAPVLGADTAYIALDKRGGGVAVGAFAATNGKRRWSTLLPTSAGSSTATSLANGVLYVGSSSGQLFALNAGTGATLATFTLASAVHGVIVAHGRLHVATFSHGLHTFELVGEGETAR
ncbi:MAG: hypothetical protein K0R38_3830 [Polyangiaceae bacterium]|nr:hypothetical protein [Polyangiaceae bacterium]